ncbi:hypothetical protein BaRGS_00015474 [Batillaria attramentaria]|uniref:Uncharacterized protein n=1 Tax=Batillaria attramentaria TaxID=370345 RepID=A0ABD0L203_9CAEN
MDTPYFPGPHIVLEKTGSKVTIQSPEGAVDSHNSSFIMKYTPDKEEEISEQDDCNSHPKLGLWVDVKQPNRREVPLKLPGKDPRE